MGKKIQTTNLNEIDNTAAAPATGAESAPAADSVAPNKTDEADVLYQKLGDKWYAFSLIDDDDLSIN